MIKPDGDCRYALVRVADEAGGTDYRVGVVHGLHDEGAALISFDINVSPGVWSPPELVSFDAIDSFSWAIGLLHTRAERLEGVE